MRTTSKGRKIATGSIFRRAGYSLRYFALFRRVIVRFVMNVPRREEERGKGWP